MDRPKLNARKLRTIALIAAIALIIGRLLFEFVGVSWAFVALFALWLAGHFVAWMKRHPSS